MKRFMDMFLVIVSLPFWLPLLIILSFMVRLHIGHPVFFRQSRPGLQGRPFMLIKLRTMSNAIDGAGNLLPDAARLTPFGRWLRTTSLDELPELWNVLRGHMSLVGPRPLLMEYLPLYTAEEARRHSVRPGVTGWAQVNGRNAISWDEKFRLDVWYVDNRSIWLDVKIVVLTLLRVFGRQGISATGEATMPRFLGSRATTIGQPTPTRRNPEMKP